MIIYTKRQFFSRQSIFSNPRSACHSVSFARDNFHPPTRYDYTLLILTQLYTDPALQQDEGESSRYHGDKSTTVSRGCWVYFMAFVCLSSEHSPKVLERIAPQNPTNNARDYRARRKVSHTVGDLRWWGGWRRGIHRHSTRNSAPKTNCCPIWQGGQQHSNGPHLRRQTFIWQLLFRDSWRSHFHRAWLKSISWRCQPQLAFDRMQSL